MRSNIAKTLSILALQGASILAITAPLAMPALAQTSEQHAFDIPAQDMAAALEVFARQANKEIIFDRAQLTGLRSKSVSGSFTPDQALRHITGGAVTIRKANAETFVVESEQPPKGEYEAGQGPAPANAMNTSERSDGEIVVTGTRIRGAAPSGSNLIVLQKEDLENSGRSTVAEAIQSLPQVHGGGVNDNSYATGAGTSASNGHPGTSSLNLRGLGAEATLTLVNGRRLAPGGIRGSFVDVSVIPFSAVQRVEVLADGASAVYGADAMAGAINIILNNRFRGAETRLRYGVDTRSGHPELTASQLFGVAGDRWSIMVAGEYFSRDAIWAKERVYSASKDLRPLGGRDYRNSYSNPGNIVSPSELAGAIPAGQDGRTLRPDQIIKGQVNPGDLNKFRYIIPETERRSIFLASTYGLSEHADLFVEMLAATRETQEQFATGAQLIVPASNAFRQINGFYGDTVPLNQLLTINYLFTGRSATTDAQSLSISSGIDYTLPAGWAAKLSGFYGQYRSHNIIEQPDLRSAESGGTLNRALTSNDLNTAFNPFSSGSPLATTLVDDLFYDDHTRLTTEYRTVGIAVDGPLFELPGGSIKLAAGSEYTRENISRSRSQQYAQQAIVSEVPFESHRSVMAAYAEIFIPLFSSVNDITGIHELNSTISGRYDHYSTFGGTFNPKVGVTWKPVKGLTLRANAGTSFKAPQLMDIFDAQSAVVYDVQKGSSDLPDPNGDGLVKFLGLTGGSLRLQPEKATSWTIGAELSPSSDPHLSFSAVYFSMALKDRFGIVNSNDLRRSPNAYNGLAYFPLPTEEQIDSILSGVNQTGIIIPSEIEAIIDSRIRNISKVRLEGIDVAARYAWDAMGGDISLLASASYLHKYHSRVGANRSETILVGRVGYPPHLRASGNLEWRTGNFSINGAVRYVSDYKNTLVDPVRRVGSYVTADLIVHTAMEGVFSRMLGKGTTALLSVTNLFDRAPPFVENPLGFGFDGANADPVGRRIALQITKRW